MADKLTELFDGWKASQADPDNLTPFQAFQAGLTMGAVSMRERAMAAVKGSSKQVNDIKNAIGQLPDIPA